MYDLRGCGLLREWCEWSGACFRVRVNCSVRFPPEALFSWHPFSLPAAAFCAGMGLATCWLQPCSQRINMFLSEMTERGGEGSKIVNMVLLISPLPDLFLIPPSWVLPQPYQIRCEQLLTSWPDGPPCQLSDVTCQSSIFTANLY